MFCCFHACQRRSLSLLLHTTLPTLDSACTLSMLYVSKVLPLPRLSFNLLLCPHCSIFLCFSTYFFIIPPQSLFFLATYMSYCNNMVTLLLQLFLLSSLLWRHTFLQSKCRLANLSGGPVFLIINMLNIYRAHTHPHPPSTPHTHIILPCHFLNWSPSSLYHSTVHLTSAPSVSFPFLAYYNILSERTLCSASRQRPFHPGNCYSMIFTTNTSGFQSFLRFQSSSLGGEGSF